MSYELHTIRDNITFSSTAADLRAPAFAVIDRLQHVHPAHQLLGSMVAVLAMADACRIPIRDLIQTAENVMSDVDACGWEHIPAIRAYATHEILRKPR